MLDYNETLPDNLTYGAIEMRDAKEHLQVRCTEERYRSDIDRSAMNVGDLVVERRGLWRIYYDLRKQERTLIEKEQTSDVVETKVKTR